MKDEINMLSQPKGEDISVLILPSSILPSLLTIFLISQGCQYFHSLLWPQLSLFCFILRLTLNVQNQLYIGLYYFDSVNIVHSY